MKQGNENFLGYAERLLSNRKDYDLEKTEIYELLYGTSVSPDHARKALAVLQMTIEECKKDNITKQINDDPDLISNQKNTIDLNKDGSQTSSRLLQMSDQQAKDVNFLLAAHGYCTKRGN